MKDRGNESVWVFFYGTFMSADVLKDFGIDCDETIPAELKGHRLTISPRVNLVPCEGESSYGGLARTTHEDILGLYGGLEKDFGVTYHPYPVIAEQFDGLLRPALCYRSHDMTEAPADPVYLDELARCAQELRLPGHYIDHIRSFA